MTFPTRLIEGYRAFVAERLPVERNRFERLAQTGQQPDVMVIGCCDSRVSPEVIFDAHPGELFVVRNVANLVPPYSPTGFTHGVSAAIEFAVLALQVKHVIVLGHTRCGGIRAFVEHRGRTNAHDFIDNWMALIGPAAAAVEHNGGAAAADYISRLEQASIVATMNNLKTFPWVRDRVDDGRLLLLGAYFDVATGALNIYDPATGAFAPLPADLPEAASPAGPNGEPAAG
jgi:carbonic anhydrase